MESSTAAARGRAPRRGCPAAARAGWLDQAAAAIDAAHAAGVVHRDVKPANLLLDSEQNVHVADFGIASAAGLDAMTRAGTVMGTAGYLSPEQARGERASAASDRYALGVVAFELLTGRRPFGRESATAEAAAHVHERVPSVCTVSGELPCELDPVFERVLAKEPAARFTTCAAFVGAIRAGLAAAESTTDGIPAQTWPANERTIVLPPERARRPLTVPLLAGLLLLAVAGIAATLFLPRHHAAAKPIVETHVVTRTARGVTRSITQTVTAAAPAQVTRAAVRRRRARPARAAVAASTTGATRRCRRATTRARSRSCSRRCAPSRGRARRTRATRTSTSATRCSSWAAAARRCRTCRRRTHSSRGTRTSSAP